MSVRTFREELHVFSRLTPLSQNIKDTAGNKQKLYSCLPWQQHFLLCPRAPLPSSSFRRSSCSSSEVNSSLFFCIFDGLQKEAGLIPACTSLTWNTQLALRWIYVFLPAVWLTILFPLQCLLCHDFISELWIDAVPGGFAWAALLLADFSTKSCDGTKACYTWLQPPPGITLVCFFFFFSRFFWLLVRKK